MFVSCGHCDAEYELDDAKIPAGGARLRCKKCDHYFVVAPPETSDLQSADDLARRALAGEVPDEAGPGPERESERGGASGPGDESDPETAIDAGFAFDADGDLEAVPDAGFAFDADGDLEAAPDAGFAFDADGDLEAVPDAGFAFEAEVDPEVAPQEGSAFDIESDLEAAPGEGSAFDIESDLEAAPDDEFALDGDGDGESAPEEEYDPDGESDWEFNDEVEISEPAVRAEAAEPEFDRGGEWGELSEVEDVVDGLLGSAGTIETDAASAVDDLLGEIDTAGPQLGESSGDSPSESEFPSERLDLGDADATDGSGGDLAADDGDSFDDMSDWDLFDQPDETGASARSAGAKSRSAPVARGGAHTEPQVEIAVAMVEDSPVSVRWTDRISEIAGWAAVLAMIAVALVGGLGSNSSETRAPLGSWSGAGFEADQIVGRWVENAIAGPIYVVSGRVRSPTGFDGVSRKTLGIQLFDTNGREIDRTLTPLAPAVPERLLRESSPAEIDAFQTRRARRLADVGENWIPFEAVLTDLPRFAARFEIQVADR